MYEQFAGTHGSSNADFGRTARAFSRRQSLPNEAITSACGSLMDAPDFVFASESNDDIETKCRRIQCLVSEIILLVDLLLADYKIPVIVPGGAA